MWNLRLDWGGRDLKAHPSVTPTLAPEGLQPLENLCGSSGPALAGPHLPHLHPFGYGACSCVLSGPHLPSSPGLCCIPDLGFFSAELGADVAPSSVWVSCHRCLQ